MHMTKQIVMWIQAKFAIFCFNARTSINYHKTTTNIWGLFIELIWLYTTQSLPCERCLQWPHKGNYQNWDQAEEVYKINKGTILHKKTSRCGWNEWWCCFMSLQADCISLTDSTCLKIWSNECLKKGLLSWEPYALYNRTHYDTCTKEGYIDGLKLRQGNIHFLSYYLN